MSTEVPKHPTAGHWSACLAAACPVPTICCCRRVLGLCASNARLSGLGNGGSIQESEKRSSVHGTRTRLPSRNQCTDIDSRTFGDHWCPYPRLAGGTAPDSVYNSPPTRSTARTGVSVSMGRLPIKVPFVYVYNGHMGILEWSHSIWNPTDQDLETLSSQMYVMHLTLRSILGGIYHSIHTSGKARIHLSISCIKSSLYSPYGRN